MADGDGLLGSPDQLSSDDLIAALPSPASSFTEGDEGLIGCTELWVEVISATDMVAPEFRSFDLVSKAMGRANALSNVYIEFQLGSGTVVRTGYVKCEHGQSVTFELERKALAYGGETELFVRAKDHRESQEAKEQLVSRIGLPKALARGDPLIGEATLTLKTADLQESEQKFVELPIKRDANAAGMVAFRYWLATRIPEPSGGWQQDSEVDSCTICGEAFTTTFRRHHCRQCGKIVCDNCSKGRHRLPRLAKGGKQRVCDMCAKTISENEATGFEEDLAVNEEIVFALRGAAKKTYAELETFKRVLLEFDAEASGDTSLLEEHTKDPESDAASFQILKERVLEQWAKLLAQREEQGPRLQELAARRSAAARRRDDVLLQERELQVRCRTLEAEREEVRQIEAERDELQRRQDELEQAVVSARKRVRELERERSQNQASPGIGLVGLPAHSPAQTRPQISPHGSFAIDPPTGTAAFTITEGRADNWGTGGRDHTGRCHRSCVCM